MSQRAVSGWAEGSLPRPEAAKKLADYFGVPAEVLLDPDQPLPPLPGYSLDVPILAGTAAGDVPATAADAHLGAIEVDLATIAALNLELQARIAALREKLAPPGPSFAQKLDAILPPPGAPERRSKGA